MKSHHFRSVFLWISFIISLLWYATTSRGHGHGWSVFLLLPVIVVSGWLLNKTNRQIAKKLKPPLPLARKKFNLSKTNWNVLLFTYVCLFCICSSVAVYCLYFVIRTLGNHTHDRHIVLAIIGIVVYLMFLKYLLEDIIAILRFYNLRIEILRDKLILRNDKKKCEIPMNKDTNVVCSLGGWLISWPSEKNQNIILLLRLLLEDNFFKELCFYFQENTNYIPSRSLVKTTHLGVPVGLPLDYYQPNADYDAAAEDEKKLLKSLQINEWNRLKYIKWPS